MGGKAGTAGTAAKKAAAKKKAAAAKKKRAATARANGKKGGRPQKHRYPDIFADLQMPPDDDPMAMSLWASKIVAQLTIETLQGRGNQALNADVRAFLGLMNRLIPIERLAAVEKQIANATSARRTPAPKRTVEVESVSPRTPGSSGRAPIRG